MTLNNVRKQIEKIEMRVEEFEGSDGRAFLVTDSKGRCLSRYLERRDYLDIIWRSGAQAGDADLLSRVNRRIEGLNSPIVLLWFGTCDFTTKGRRGKLSLSDLTHDDVMTKLVTMKEAIIECNGSAEVFLLQCPVYSMVTWNEAKGHETDDGYDRTLEDLVAQFNESIDDYNMRYTPNFSLDLEKCTKNKGRSARYLYRLTELYTDGIHPGTELSKLWLLKIKQLVINVMED